MRGIELTNQIVVRLDPETDRLIRAIAKARGQDVSNFLRAVIKTELGRLSYLSLAEKKALGIEVNNLTGNSHNPD